MQKWNIAYRINNHYDFNSLISKLEKVKKDFNVKITKRMIPDKKYPTFQPLPSDFKIVIIDFEGSPVFLCGVMIHNIILTYYIENPLFRNELFLVIFRILKIAEDLSFFAFSDHERIELLNMYRYLEVQEYDVSEFQFIEKFPIINLQDKNSHFESLQEAIYSINPNSVQMTDDPLFRNNKLVDLLFNARKFDEIISHNVNCLLNESVLFLKRWYKNYKI